MTYRYSPLLAVALLPNVWLHPAWQAAAGAVAPSLPPSPPLSPPSLFFARGKLLFCCLDLAAARLAVATLRARGGADAAPGALRLCASLALLNPLTAAVSARGSCDALHAAALLASLRCCYPCGPGGGGSGPGPARPAAAGALLGLAAHLRLYPAVHALPLALHALLAPPPGRRSGGSSSRRRRGSLAWAPALRLACAFAAAFSLLLLASVALCGRAAAAQAVGYHAARADPRHNFSPAFYPAYLGHAGGGGAGPPPPPSHPHPPLLLLRRVVSGPGPPLAAAAAVGLSYGLGRDPAGALFFQPLAMVALSPVVTAQYFAWWAAPLPLLAPRLARLGGPGGRGGPGGGGGGAWRRPALAAAAWAAALALWLAAAARLEFGLAGAGAAGPRRGGGWRRLRVPPPGRDEYLPVWAASLLFLAASTSLTVALLRALPPEADPGGDDGGHGGELKEM